VEGRGGGGGGFQARIEADASQHLLSQLRASGNGIPQISNIGGLSGESQIDPLPQGLEGALSLLDLSEEIQIEGLTRGAGRLVPGFAGQLAFGQGLFLRLRIPYPQVLDEAGFLPLQPGVPPSLEIRHRDALDDHGEFGVEPFQLGHLLFRIRWIQGRDVSVFKAGEQALQCLQPEGEPWEPFQLGQGFRIPAGRL